MKTIFGYQYVTGVPPCPCRDPGNYLMMEQPGDDPLEFTFRCWCGRRISGTFDSAEERTEFLRDNGAAA